MTSGSSGSALFWLRHDDHMNHAGEAILIFTQRNQARIDIYCNCCRARTFNTCNTVSYKEDINVLSQMHFLTMTVINTFPCIMIVCMRTLFLSFYPSFCSWQLNNSNGLLSVSVILITVSDKTWLMGGWKLHTTLCTLPPCSDDDCVRNIE